MPSIHSEEEPASSSDDKPGPKDIARAQTNYLLKKMRIEKEAEEFADPQPLDASKLFESID